MLDLKSNLVYTYLFIRWFCMTSTLLHQPWGPFQKRPSLWGNALCVALMKLTPVNIYLPSIGLHYVKQAMKKPAPAFTSSPT